MGTRPASGPLGPPTQALPSHAALGMPVSDPTPTQPFPTHAPSARHLHVAFCHAGTRSHAWRMNTWTPCAWVCVQRRRTLE